MSTKAFRNADEAYRVLGVASSSSIDVCNRAYKLLARKYHPDTSDLPEAEAMAKFSLIAEAYSVVKAIDRGEVVNFVGGSPRTTSYSNNVNNTGQVRRTRPARPTGTILRHKDLMSFIIFET